MLKKLLFCLILCALTTPVGLFAQSNAMEEVLRATNQAQLMELSMAWQQRYLQQRMLALEQAAKLGWPLRWENSRGDFIELDRLTDWGEPLYRTTDNRIAARTISANRVYPGGSAGLSLTGQGLNIGIWDGGAVRGTHQELTGRVTQVDGATSLSAHATHVAGTLMASGVDTNARGMAYQANLRAFDWNNDNSEMATAAAGGLLISNHSYGWISGWHSGSTTNGTSNYWYGWEPYSRTEDYKFGYYDEQARDWDQIINNAPFYLIVKSAGNDRGDTRAAGTSHNVQDTVSPFGWRLSTTTRNADGNAAGYDCIVGGGVGKNVMTVGAVNGITNGYTNPESVVMSSFSGWGPTDDGRIKPDLVAKGVGTYSSTSSSNTAYSTLNGTSMSSPSLSGGLLLLQQHYNNLKNRFMRSSTLKALAIHTADEAGSNPGPDYRFGWGLLNVQKAAQTITLDGSTEHVLEDTLKPSQTWQMNVYSDGVSPLRTTLGWNDPAATLVAQPNVTNNTSSRLVNDLDVRLVRISDNTTFQPWILNPASPANAATTGDNFRDNVEQILISAPAAGWYTIRITHKGSLRNNQNQLLSLVISGARRTSIPQITSFNPTSAGTGASVTIRGNNFTGATAVSFGNVAATSFTVNNDTTITAVVASGASGSVSVVNPNGTGSRAGFVFVAAPSITSFSPTTAGASSQVVILGTNLSTVQAVSFGGVQATSFTVSGDTSITAIVGAGASGNVSLTTVGGSVSIPGFTFVPAPTLTQFTPAIAGANTAITLVGTQLTTTTSVSFGGVNASAFTVLNDSTLSATVGTGASGQVVITTLGGQAQQPGFTFVAMPVISSFSPASAISGTTVVIRGSGFTNATSVAFGGTSANSYQVINDTTIHAIVGQGSSGAVSVTTIGGVGSRGGFTFSTAPVIRSVSPRSAYYGETVTIIGNNFTGATSLQMGNIPVGVSASGSFTVVNDTLITAIAMNAIPNGNGKISVTTPGGTVTKHGFYVLTPAVPGVVAVRGDITTNTTWTKNNTYLLKGMVIVRNGATLTIEPGTQIKGELGWDSIMGLPLAAGGLMIARDGYIQALGTECDPIVFGSNSPVGRRFPGQYPGDWLGLVVLGESNINLPGGQALFEDGFFGEEGRFGGNDANDSSGVLKYIRIEYAGGKYFDNQAIAGLTMAGVGRKTQIDHIQISFSGEKAFEWLGGTSNASHLIAYRNVDEDLSASLGYQGNVQFVYALRDPAFALVGGTSGLAAMNDSLGSSNSPINAGNFSNITVLGPREQVGVAVNSSYNHALNFSGNAATSIYNSVFTGFPTGLHLDGSGVGQQYASNALQLSNNVFANMAANFSNAVSPVDQARFDANNSRFSATSSLGFASGYNNLNTPVLLPNPGSILQTGASFVNSRLQDSFFDSVSFRGAFGTQDWTLGWSRWDLNNSTFHALRPTNATYSVQPNGTSVNIGFKAGTGTSLTYFVQYKLAQASNWTTSSMYNGIMVSSGATIFNRQLTLNTGNYDFRIGIRSGGGAINWGCVNRVNLACNRDVLLFPTHVFCAYGNDGRITSSYVNFKAPYTVSWRNANNVQIGTGSSVSSLRAGVYSLTVTDNLGCSATKSVTITQPDTNNVPRNLIVTGSNLSRRIVFNRVPGAVRYQYIGFRADGVLIAARTVGAGTANDTVLQLASNPVYQAGGAGTVRARIRAVMPTSTSSYTCEVFGSIALPTRTIGEEEPGEVVADLGLLAYPNPASHQLLLQYAFKKSGTAILSVYAMNGALVMRKMLNGFEGVAKETLEVEQLSKGLYLIQVVEGDEMETARVILGNQ